MWWFENHHRAFGAGRKLSKEAGLAAYCTTRLRLPVLPRTVVGHGE